MRRHLELLACGLLASLAVAQGDAGDLIQPQGIIPPRIDRARFDELQRLLRPDATAPWRSIAWRTGLLSAQREAAVARKPLFIWAMDGHPLGCT